MNDGGNQMMKIIIILLIAVTASGCFADNADSNIQAPPDSGKDTQQFFLTDTLDAHGCSGLAAAQFYPPFTNPAPVPEGWPRSDNAPLTAISILAWTCESIGLDGLERSATMFWEVATIAIPPQPCFDDAQGIMAHVINVLTDDEDLKEILQDRYGAPVSMAEFEIEDGIVSHTWTWSVNGVQSTFEAIQDSTRDSRDLLPNRWVWPRPDGITVMDLTFHVEEPEFANRAGIAQLAEPHYMETAAGQYVGATNVVRDASLTGRLELRDAQCE